MQTIGPGTQSPTIVTLSLNPSDSVPENMSMTVPALEALALVRHSMERQIPRTTRYVIMGWCWHYGLRLEDFFALVFFGKKDTH